MLQRCALARVPSASALALALRSASTMRAVVLDEPGPITNLKLHEAWPVPYADEGTLPDTHVRIKVAACAVAYRDIIDRTGGFPFMQRPTILGHVRRSRSSSRPPSIAQDGAQPWILLATSS